MSSDCSANDVLAGYLAGRVTAEQLVAAVSAEYYREIGNGKRETLRPIIEIVERAHPGVVELTATDVQPGFDVRSTARPFPRRYEAELREAVEQALQTFPVSRLPFAEDSRRKPGLLQRIVAAIRKVFNS